MGRLRYGVGTSCLTSNTSKQQSWDLNPGSLIRSAPGIFPWSVHLLPRQFSPHSSEPDET